MDETITENMIIDVLVAAIAPTLVVEADRGVEGDVRTREGKFLTQTEII
jgi:hypothetical protein